MSLVSSFSHIFFLYPDVKKCISVTEVYIAFNKSFNVCSTFFYYRLQT